MLNIDVFRLGSLHSPSNSFLGGHVWYTITLDSELMEDKIARLKYLNNSFEILENGSHVLCAVSGKKIPLEKLNYWNVDLQEPYFSYIEANMRREK